MKQQNGITWSSRLVNVGDVKPTPNNFKIKTDLGRERLQQSLKSFGLAGTIVVNTDLVLIDGNSRLEEAKESKVKKIWASMPSRKLTSKEFTEMSALFDFAVAGKVDTERIQKELGTSDTFYKKWGFEIPFELLESMGSKASMNGLEYPEDHEKGKSVEEVKDIRMVQIFFTIAQEAQFRKWEIELRKRLKVGTTTDLIYKIVEMYCKQNKVK